MKTAQQTLEKEFATDHREMTQGFARLLELLRSGEDAEARQLASDVDRLAGPHIEFEETVLYPAIAREEGQDFAARLNTEHATVLEAIKSLLSQPNESTIDDNTRERLIEQFQTGLDHAETCGSLMGHLTTLDESQHQTYLQQLLECRERGRRWSDRHHTPASEAS